jgi:hypothetical protein
LAQFSSDGRTVARYAKWRLGEEDPAGTLWDLNSKELERQVVFPVRPRADDFVVAGRTLISVTVERPVARFAPMEGPATVEWWDLHSPTRRTQCVLEKVVGFRWEPWILFMGPMGARLQSLPGELTLAPDGKTAAAATASPSKIIVWSAVTGKKLQEIRVPEASLGYDYKGFRWHRRFLYAPDGRHLALLNTNGTVQIVRLGDNEEGRLLDHYQRGLVHARGKDYARAIGDFTEVIRLDPNHAWAYQQRGLAYAEQGEQARAKADLDKAFQLDPKLAQKK